VHNALAPLAAFIIILSQSISEQSCFYFLRMFLPAFSGFVQEPSGSDVDPRAQPGKENCSCD